MYLKFFKQSLLMSLYVVYIKNDLNNFLNLIKKSWKK